MDEADCCSLPKSLDEAGCALRVPDSDRLPGNDTGERHVENFLNATVQENHWLLSSFPVAGEPQACGRQSGRASLNENGFSVVGRVVNGHDGRLPAQNGDSRMVTTPSCQSREPERGQSDRQFAHGHLATESEANDEACHNHSACDTTNSSDAEIRLHGDSGRDDAPAGGVDETDQGQVVSALNLTENNSEYSPQLSRAQYYTKQVDGFLRSPVLDTTVIESSGRTGTCNLQAAINDTPVTSRQEDTSATSSCAISQSGTTVQGQPQPNNSKSPLASSRPVEPEEVAKRKMCLPEEGGGDLSGMSKKQKVSPTSHSDVQYNQNILSMPRQYRVGGTGNYVFDSPNNCTFHLYQNHSSNLSPRQHAFEWAGLSTQTDSITGVMPVQALETVAKLIAQTTNWKTFARRLPMSDCGSLETDIRTLEECQGTTSDKASAVLMRWWRGHPGQADAAAMKARLKEGLESCSLIRLARTLDKYL